MSSRRFLTTLFCLALAAASAVGSAVTAQRTREPRRDRGALAPRGQKDAPRLPRARGAATFPGAPGAWAAPARSGSRPAEPVAEGEFEGGDGEARHRWFYFKRAYPFEHIPADARRRAWESRPRRKGREADLLAASDPAWKPVGPAPTVAGFHANWGATSGRINAVAVHPTDARVVLVGASTGGLWRSADGGQTFAPVSDDQVELAVGSIAFARSNPSVVYAGMGDLDNAFVGTGVLRSADGGRTWARVNNSSLPARGYVADLAVDPSDPSRVYAAQAVTLDEATNTNASGGLYVSADGGVNWSKTLAGRARSLALHPANPRTVYAALSDAPGGGRPGVYKSTDGGQTWALAYASPFGAETRDIRVAVTAADPARVYVYSGARTGSPRVLRLEVSRDGGATWSERGAAGVVGLDPGQFGYNTYLHVSPSDADTLYVGSRDIYKSTDGGLSWANLTRNFTDVCGAGRFCFRPEGSNTHTDQQALAFAPGDARVLYAANDGGLSRSTDGGATFRSLNATLSLTQFVHLSLHPTDPARSYGGTQDNGSQRRAPGAREWVEFHGGDGGRSVINPRDPSVVFSTQIFGFVYRHRHHGLSEPAIIASDATFGEGGPGSAPRIAFYPPFVGNGVDQKLYFGTWRLFVCTNCDARHAFSTPPADWAAPAGALDLTRGVTPQGSDVLTAIGVARSNTNVIYTGSAFGRAMASRDGGRTWSDVSAGLPNRVIESITVHPSNPSVAYLTVSGYGSGHVFKTADGGATWADVSGNLPNVPTAAFLIDPRNPSVVYAGTDIGVFRSAAGGGTWESFGEGMPPAVVTAFAAQANGRIQAATYGRGAYEFVPGPASVVSFSAAAFAASEAEGRARLTVTRTSAAAPATVEYSTADGTARERADYAAARGTLAFAAGEGSKTLDVPVSDDRFLEPAETFSVSLGNPSGATLGAHASAAVTLASDDAATSASPVKWGSFDARFFVRQHYLDFLGREPDAGGLGFWTNQITSCGADAACAEARRVNVSAAFFLSIEFQETGFLVYRAHKAAFGNLAGKPVPVTRLTMLAESRRLGEGVVVGLGDWAARLEANKRAYFERVAASAAFGARHPQTRSPEEFVEALNANAGNPLTPAERGRLAAELGDGRKGRAEVLRAVAEDADLARAELNKAFVLMQYFGYLRRNPDDGGNQNFGGFFFWLKKLEDHGGDFVRAEMVKAFLVSLEYGERFGR